MREIHPDTPCMRSLSPVLIVTLKISCKSVSREILLIVFSSFIKKFVFSYFLKKISHYLEQYLSLRATLWKEEIRFCQTHKKKKMQTMKKIRRTNSGH